MTLHVVLVRVGQSRVSADSIPIEARVIQGSQIGNDLVEKLKPTTVERAKEYAQHELDRMFGCSVNVEWVDRTE